MASTKGQEAVISEVEEMAIKEEEAKNDDTEELIGIFDKENTAEIW